MAGLDPATHAFAALNRPRALLERETIFRYFCEPVANVEFVIEARGVDGQARPGGSSAAERQPRSGSTQQPFL
jgi:hypothetical protein